eukprot:184852_1
MLQFILLVGCYMNSGTKKGDVAGFNVESLLALGANKSTDKTESLLSFIVKQLKQNDDEALTFKNTFIKNLPAAIKLDPEDIRSGIEGIGKMLSGLQSNIKDIEDKKEEEDEDKDNEDDKEEDKDEDMFNTVMGKFYKIAIKQHKSLENDFKKTLSDLSDLGKYLGQKNDEEFEYMEFLFDFASNVEKEYGKILKIEADKQKKIRQALTKQKQKEQREKRKKEKQKQK